MRLKELEIDDKSMFDLSDEALIDIFESWDTMKEK